MFLDRFDILMSKIKLKKLKKYYSDIFPNKTYFEKKLLSQC
jgi:hypothetical protein